MGKYFAPDTKVYRFFNTAWELLVLNLLTLLLCIPIVTAGASLTAMHDMALRIVRGEEGYIGKGFFKAFRENFKRATILWLAFLILFFSYRVDWVIAVSNPNVLGKPVQYAIVILAIVTFMLMQFVFPLQAHFENNIFTTVRNAAILMISKFPRTLVMTLIWLVPYEILNHSIALFPLVVMLGLSFPGFVCAKMCDPVFKMLEPEEEKMLELSL